MNYDTLWNQSRIVGHIPDNNGNDTVMEFLDIGTYYLSLSGMPTACITDDNKIVVCYATVMEGLDNGVENYRHIFQSYSEDGNIWSLNHNLNTSIIHNYDECVFPFLSPTNDHSIQGYTTCHLIYQGDEEPGMAVWGSDPPDPFTDNYQYHCMFPFIVGGLTEGCSVSGIDCTAQPNPSNTQTEFLIDLKNPALLNLEIRNMLGQPVHKTVPTFVSTGQTRLVVNVSNFQPGIYTYTIIAGERSLTKKIIVQH
jgi:hypothetical protein